ncbi:hypothetical protein ACOCEA_07000 [Maribacter sp. CXY002]|uniref:hypothetical protein n=1 Tax=Maribacter luteocoastalis TaxID=3407671 RepID=UPI003B67CEA7
MDKIIFFELNEVPIRVFNYYRKMRPNSWIALNYPKFKKYETITENKGHLSPWNTWPTLHRGVPSDKHFVSDFNQNLTEVDKEFPPIWDLLSSNGVKTGVFGSLHSQSVPLSLDNYNFFVPDVFAPNHECFPKDVEFFQKINLNLSRKSGRNVDNSLPYSEILNGLLHIRKLGLKLDTMTSVAKQLVEERIDPWKNVRRRTYQTVLSFDVFYKLLNDKRPDFVTFFTNHVASSMHRYWAALFPNEYEKLDYDDEWINTYSDEILFTMNHTDRMLKRLSDFIDKNQDYKLIITSSMGQDAIECEPIETQIVIVDNPKFMAILGLKKSDQYKVMPAMVPQFNFVISEDHVDVFEENLKSMTINNDHIIYRKKDANYFSIDLIYLNLQDIQIKVGNTSFSMDDSGLKNIVIDDKSSATAYHIPEGHLFSYHPRNEVSSFITKHLPTCDILPIILNNYGIKQKEYMNNTSFIDL